MFLLNALMDYLLLLLTARMAGVPLRRRRYLLVALFGGIYAVAVFCPGGAVLAAPPVKIAAGGVMAVVAFGWEVRLVRLMLLFLLVSCGMAGCVLGLGLLAGETVPVVRGILYTDINLRVLVLSAAVAYGALAVVFRSAGRHGLQGQLIPVRLSIGGAETELTALWDSGNSLREPETGRPVLIVTPEVVRSLLPYEVQSFLTPVGVRSPADLMKPLMAVAPALRPRLLPYRAVGCSGGLLLTLQTDWVEVCGERHRKIRVALSSTELGEGYRALWGGETGKGGRHGMVDETGTKGSAVASAAGKRSLHWRQ